MTGRVSEDWSGRSLSFIRQVYGEDARYGSAIEAFGETNVLPPEPGKPPPVGRFCWYRSPRGNVTLSLGDGQVLGIRDSTGRPHIFNYLDPILGEYLGHSGEIGDPVSASRSR